MSAAAPEREGMIRAGIVDPEEAALGGRDQVSERRDMPDVDGLPACQSQDNKGGSSGSVAKFWLRQNYCDLGPMSGGNIEQRLDEGGLGDNVTPADPFYCPFLIIARVS